MANSIFLEAFLDGATGAGLFGKLRRPGAPTELIDSRSVEEFVASGDFEKSMESLGYHHEDDVAAGVPAQVGPTILIKGMRGATGVLSPDGEHVTWYVDGVEVSGTEVFPQQESGRNYRLRVARGLSIAAAAEHEQEHHHQYFGGR